MEVVAYESSLFSLELPDALSTVYNSRINDNEALLLSPEDDRRKRANKAAIEGLSFLRDKVAFRCVAYPRLTCAPALLCCRGRNSGTSVVCSYTHIYSLHAGVTADRVSPRLALLLRPTPSQPQVVLGCACAERIAIYPVIWLRRRQDGGWARR